MEVTNALAYHGVGLIARLKKLYTSDFEGLSLNEFLA
jgi:hypothetical protein